VRKTHELACLGRQGQQTNSQAWALEDLARTGQQPTRTEEAQRLSPPRRLGLVQQTHHEEREDTNQRHQLEHGCQTTGPLEHKTTLLLQWVKASHHKLTSSSTK